MSEALTKDSASERFYNEIADSLLTITSKYGFHPRKGTIVNSEIKQVFSSKVARFLSRDHLKYDPRIPTTVWSLEHVYDSAHIKLRIESKPSRNPENPTPRYALRMIVVGWICHLCKRGFRGFLQKEVLDELKFIALWLLRTWGYQFGESLGFVCSNGLVWEADDDWSIIFFHETGERFTPPLFEEKECYDTNCHGCILFAGSNS